MNPFKLLGQMPASDSPQFSVNALDLKKIGREAVMMIIPLSVPVITSMEGYRYTIHGADCTVVVVVGLRLVLEGIRRLIAGEPKV